MYMSIHEIKWTVKTLAYNQNNKRKLIKAKMQVQAVIYSSENEKKKIIFRFEFFFSD